MKAHFARLRNSGCRVLAAVFLISILALGVVPGVSAASSIVLESSVDIVFPNSVTFKVKAQSDSNIAKLRLHYKVGRQNIADVTSESWPQFEPAKSVQTQWVWDMRRGGLPPGATVQYWWSAEDSAGKRTETSATTFSFDDRKHVWQTMTNGPVTLLWYRGDRAFADSLMAAAQQGLQRLRNDTGAVPQRRARIFIYGSTQELHEALLFPQEWTGGQAFVEFDTIVIGVAPDQLAFGTRAVPHELSHWLVGQLTQNNYEAGLPVWLDEGFATYGEGPVSQDYEARVSNAVRTNTLISIRSLSSPFSADPVQALLSYAESRSVVAFLIGEYGRDKFNQLLDVFRQGSGYDDALKKVYGFDQDGLEAIWKQSIGARSAFVPAREPALAMAS